MSISSIYNTSVHKFALAAQGQSCVMGAKQYDTAFKGHHEITAPF